MGLCVCVCVCACVCGWNRVSLVEIATSSMVWDLNPSRGKRISFLLLQNMQVSGAQPGFCFLSTRATFWVWGNADLTLTFVLCRVELCLYCPCMPSSLAQGQGYFQANAHYCNKYRVNFTASRHFAVTLDTIETIDSIYWQWKGTG
jgi:hypothetical protein